MGATGLPGDSGGGRPPISRHEARFNRLRGMSTEQNLALQAQLEGLDDWYGTCQDCGEKLRGTLQMLKEHRCADGT